MNVTTVPELLARSVHEHGQRVALERYSGPGAPRDPVTFSALAAQVEERRRQLPPSPGPVALLLDNGPEWAISFLAIVSDGRPAVLVDSDLRLPEVIPQLVHSEAVAVVTDADRASELRPEWLQHAAGRPPPEVLTAGQRWMERPHPPGMLGPAAPAAILYTSGSTGSPKGVVLSHQALVNGGMRCVDSVDLKPRDATLALVPFSHVTGPVSVFLCALAAGARLVFLDSLKPPTILAALREAEITVLVGPPTLYEPFARRIAEKMDALPPPARAVAEAMRGMVSLIGRISASAGASLAWKLFSEVHQELGPRLVSLMSSGAPMRPETHQSLTLLGFDVRQGYGLSESGGVVTLERGRHTGRPGQCGPAMPGSEIRISEPDPEGIGEIWIKSDQNMQGYLRDPARTAEALVEGWLRTGDLGRLEQGGRLRVRGRQKDVIVTGAGEKVYPEDLEAHFATVPGLGEICVLGVPASDGGQAVALVATPAQPSDGAVAALEAQLEKRNAELASDRRATRIVVRTQELPRTTARQVQRHRLAEEMAHG
ncbi:MAG TPA: AMP-binding protein [Myxococcaceae bacterium]|nr:AMP-binding protein [Myxococcaceae bacterium]